MTPLHKPLDRPFQPVTKALLLGFLLVLLSMVLPAYASNQDGGVKIRSNTQRFDLLGGSSHFEGNLLVAMEGTQVTGSQADIKMGEDGKPDKAIFTNRPTMVRKSENMKQTIQADTLNMGLNSGALEAQGKVMTKIDGDESLGKIVIHSDTQTFDQDKNLMKAVGHVFVQKDGLTVTSPEAIVFLSDAGSAEKAIFMKGARLTQGKQEMKAETITIRIDTGDIFAEKNTESFMESEDSQGKLTKVVVRSHLQELDRETGTLFANGNAVVHYEDYVAKGPKAVFYRNNDKFDKVVLTGRAQIEDNDRKVMGDTVTMTMNPKQFNAQGNVNTFIKAKKQQKVAGASTSTTQTATAGAAQSTEQKTESHAKPSTTAHDDELMIENLTQEADKTP